MDIKALFGFEGKKVVITGAASGMARAATELLIALGAEVHAIDLNPIDLPVAKAYQANLAEKEEIERIVTELPDHIEAFFSCHGVSHVLGREILLSKINFLGQKYMTELLVPKMNEWGSVTYISSIGAFGWEQDFKNCRELIEQPTWEDSIKWYESHMELLRDPINDEGSLDYGFSKKCVSAYVVMKAYDPMFISKKIRLNAICPGMTLTGLSEGFNLAAGHGDAEAGNQALKQMMIAAWGGREAQAYEMGYPLVCLGSKICSYVSAQNLYIDFGCSASWLHGGLMAQLG